MGVMFGCCDWLGSLRAARCNACAEFQSFNGNHSVVAPAKAGAQRRLLHCRTLIGAIALRGYRPGLGPAAEFLSLLRQRKESKKGDRRLALRVLTLRFSIIFASQKMGRSATRYAQTSDLLFPFSVTQKLHRPKRIKVKSNVKNNGKTKIKIKSNTKKITASTPTKIC
ncbi:hypothetical protein H8L32_25600 [Undibacterium sp. CY18W]|uniref:Uncharacterized protein n=1 Tax=Undibacterium hunanense TaxID=2762292 RepID=A0ABR6ZZ62_9BURK|nr:hypothetical protein [Undibacterium hunanense]MBC3920865.1 hypothetical protein [Undibacterium hunanense]